MARNLRWIVVTATFLGGFGECAFANDAGTVQNASGSWTETTIWENGYIPTNDTSSDKAYINSGSTVTLSEARSVGCLVGTGSGSTMAVLNIGADFTVGAVSHWNGCSFFLVGDGRQVTLNQTDGTTNVLGKMSIGCDNGTAIYNQSSGTTLNATSGLWIADNTGGNGGGSGTLNVSGTVNVGGDDGLTMNGGVSTLNINSGGVVQTRKFSFGSGNNIALNVNGGTIKVDAASSGTNFLPSTGTVNIQTGGATFDTNGVSATIGGALKGSAAMTKSGEGTLILSGSNSGYTGTATVSAGTLQIGNGTDAVSWGGAITNNATLNFKTPSDFTLTSKAVVNSGALIKDGNGKLTLGQKDSRFGGNITVNAGMLSLANWDSDGSSATTTVGTGATLEFLTASRTFSGAITGMGAVRVAGPGRTTLNNHSDYRGGTTIVAGSQLMLGNGVAEGMVTGNIDNGGTLTFYTGGSLSARVGTTFTGSISGSGVVFADGYGKTTLSGANDYSGITMIDKGTLALETTGTIENSTVLLLGGSATIGTFDVSKKDNYVLTSGKTLAGSGAVVGSMALAEGTLITPSVGTATNSIGALSFNESLQLAGDLAMDISKSGAVFTSDLITSGKTLTLGGKLTVTALGDSVALGDTWNLFDAASFGGSFGSFVLPTLTEGLVWNTSRLATNGTLSVAAVPEPGTLASCIAMMVGLIAYAWRKRK